MRDKFYMMGVCGMGMAPLAAFLKDGGADVEGYDDHPDGCIKSALEKCGVRFAPPYRFGGDRKVVISSALKLRRPEISAATGCFEIFRRGECWAEVCASRKLTAVVGSHGKSTVSALISHAAMKTEDCGHLVGAIPVGFPMHRYCADKKIIISEIDESDGTIENFSPEVTVALNADLDHIDTYADNLRLREMFERLFARTKKTVLYPESDAMLSEIAAKSKTHSRAVRTSGGFMSVNIAMALAALEETFGRPFSESALEGYRGLLRRQEIIFDSRGVRAVADYAHHPNEVRSFLDWFSKKFEGEKIIAFQPHRYTRTRRFSKEFADVLGARLGEAQVLLLPVYPASEPFDPLGESSAITAHCAGIKLANCGDFFKMVSEKLKASKSPLNIAIVGAGDFYFDAKEFFQKLK